MSISHEVAHVVNDINKLSPEDRETIYGVIVKENGKVVDVAYNREFDTVNEWAQFFVTDDGSSLQDDEFDEF